MGRESAFSLVLGLVLEFTQWRVLGALARESETTFALPFPPLCIGLTLSYSPYTLHVGVCPCLCAHVWCACARVLCIHAYMWVHQCTHASCQRERGPSLIAGWEMGSLPAKQLDDWNQVHGKSMSLSASINFKSP